MRQTEMSENLDNQNPLIEVQDLQHYYGTKLVLDVKSWQLLKNEHQLLLGPSGIGKTTLLGILTGLLSPSKGSINALGRSITDEPISKLSSFRARNIGFVFQDHHLVSSLTINENLILARHLADLPIDQKWANITARPLPTILTIATLAAAVSLISIMLQFANHAELVCLKLYI